MNLQIEDGKQSSYFFIFFLDSNTPPIKIPNESMEHATESSSRNLGIFNVLITRGLNPPETSEKL